MKKNSFTLIAVFITSLVCKSEALWQKLGGPGGGSIKSLVSTGNKIYAGTDNGIFISSDTGTNWRSVSQGLPDDKNIVTVSAGNTSIFAATLWNGIYKSKISDSCSWEHVADVKSGDFLSSLVATGNTIFAGTEKGVFLISRDDGSTWKANDSLFKDYPVRCIATRDSFVFVGAGTDLFISNDNAVTWNKYIVDDIHGLTCIHVVDSFLIASNLYGNVYRSIDNGITWKPVTNGLSNARIENFTSNGSIILGGSCSYFPSEIPGVFESSDRGETWTKIDSVVMNKNVLSLAIYADKIFAGTQNEGVFKRGINGAGWVDVSNGLSLPVTRSYVSNCEIFAGTEHGLFISTDGSKTWTRADSINPDFKITDIKRCDNAYLVSTDAGGIYSTIDNGQSWSKTAAFDSTYTVAVNDSFLLAGNSRGIQICRVNDSVWTWVTYQFPQYGILSIAAHDSMVFAGGYYSGLFRSSDYGKTWNPVDTTNFSASLTSSIVISGDTILASLLMRGLYRSTDNGIHWEKLTGILSGGYGDLAIINGIVFVTTLTQVYYSEDFGSTWKKASTGLENKSIYSLSVAGNDLYAGTELDGIWHRSVSDVLTPVIEHKAHHKSSKSTAFRIKWIGQSMKQAILEFSLPEYEKVKVTLYDIRGREINSPVNRFFDPGLHQIFWNTTGIVPGFYYVKMCTGKNVNVKKLLKTY